MISTLLINHIVVGEIEINQTSEVLIPNLKTYITGYGYSVIMKYYLNDFLKESIKVVYLLTEFDSPQVYTTYEFNSEQIDTENIEEFYCLLHNKKGQNCK